MTDVKRIIKREALSAFVESTGWNAVLDAAEAEIISVLRARALTEGRLDPREHTGVVRSLEALRAFVELPYAQIARAANEPIEQIVPERIRKFFT